MGQVQTLAVGEKLTQDKPLCSPDGKVELKIHKNGLVALVHSKDGRVFGRSSYNGKDDTYHVEVQENGTLLEKDSKGNVVWSSGKAGLAGESYYLTVTNAPAASIYKGKVPAAAVLVKDDIFKP